MITAARGSRVRHVRRGSQCRPPTSPSPPPGIGPVAVDKATGKACYLSTVPLPVALDMAPAARDR